MLAAVLVIGIHGIGKEYLVKDREASDVAGAYAEYDKVLARFAGVLDFQILAVNAQIVKILRLREEKVLGGAVGIELLRQLHALRVFRVNGDVVLIRRDIELFMRRDLPEKVLQIVKRKLIHYALPPL